MDFDGINLRWRISSRPAKKTHPHGKPGEEHLDADQVGPELRLRHWQPGDRFQPLGFRQSTKLQDLLVNRKVPAAQRRRLLVAESARGELCWVEGMPPGEACKLGPVTGRRLVLRWQRRATG